MLASFNYVYRYITIDWIIICVVIIGNLQISSFVATFIGIGIRFIGLKIELEKIFNNSKKFIWTLVLINKKIIYLYN